MSRPFDDARVSCARWLAILSIGAGLHACGSDAGVVGSYTGISVGTLTAIEPASARPIEESAQAVANVRIEGRRLVVSFSQDGRPVPCPFAATGGPATWTFTPNQACRQGRPDDGTTITVTSGTARFENGEATIEVRSSVAFTGSEVPMRSGTHVMRFSGRRE